MRTIIGILWSIGNLFLKAYVISCYYTWLIQTSFENAPIIAFKQFLALAIMYSIFTDKLTTDQIKKIFKPKTEEETEDNKMWFMFGPIIASVMYLIILFIGWLYYRLYFL